MKTIGLLGGMSWESTETYYRLINEGVKKALGGLHSAKIAMVSVDFEPLEKCLQTGDWGRISAELCRAAKNIQAAGADFMLICTNTMHKVAPDIEEAVDIPLLHIADAAAQALVKDEYSKVGLLGTAFTMEQDFFTGRLARDFGLEVVIPKKGDREIVNDIIFQELCLGQVLNQSREEYAGIAADLAAQGAQAIILGCTEIGMLLDQKDAPVPLYDTTVIHAQQAVAYALKG
ncbi:aspartate racemase [Desulfatibacillum alkenivorans DSM 16219]|jgi:aspartate racemase|uniref:Aspartate racemase n=1 Tax=Desulfatibacillum alkenivorans DSM 16219 TaxID=1121393 RepID=A0A1M6EL57_9BACT|nr:aspartate/glutamate racemase family protein [Desulfatibacillum alkenivorans]SHI86018.1 aspartate racemase [Desulfatibacillum alkenivorans DSM 16219]